MSDKGGLRFPFPFKHDSFPQPDNTGSGGGHVGRGEWVRLWESAPKFPAHKAGHAFFHIFQGFLFHPPSPSLSLWKCRQFIHSLIVKSFNTNSVLRFSSLLIRLFSTPISLLDVILCWCLALSWHNTWVTVSRGRRERLRKDSKEGYGLYLRIWKERGVRVSTER